jgi:hypothetical protein
MGGGERDSSVKRLEQGCLADTHLVEAPPSRLYIRGRTLAEAERNSGN